LEPLDTARIVDEVQQRLGNMITDYEALFAIPESWPPALGYPAWVEEVWTNYISNALKYGGSPPHIKLGATVEGNMVRFWVRDNGEGLTQEQQEQLFDKFVRLDKTRAEGHGLGLSIVHRIIEKLGGEVAVKSQLGEGSVFSFTLPRAAN
jgi:signal transduction histidine kinase